MDRFESLGVQELNPDGYSYCKVEVLRDKQTGVMYMYRAAMG